MAFVPAALGLALLLSGQGPAAAPVLPLPTPASDLPISLSRIRAGLKKPESRLTRPVVKADFRVEIDEAQRFQDLLALIDFGSTSAMPSVMFGSPGSQPLVKFSVANSAITGKISAARRERAERLAREEVARALADSCTGTECIAPR